MKQAKAETFTFRLDPAMKTELTESAAEYQQQPAELVRTLVRDHLAARRRQAFEAEARRQCLLVNNHPPDSDAAQIMRELDVDLKDFNELWK